MAGKQDADCVRFMPLRLQSMKTIVYNFVGYLRTAKS